MNRLTMRFCFMKAILIILTVMFCAAIHAQAKGPVTGLDISVEKLDAGCYDRSYLASGVVYEVLGIASLRPAANAEVYARLGKKTVKFVTDARGVFQIRLKVPKESEIEGQSNLEIEVKKGRHSREYSFPVSLHSPLKAVVKTDRRRYEPGETVHFWSRIDDVLTGRPLADIPVVITSTTGERRETVTSKAGVAAADFAIGAKEPYGEGSVSLAAEGHALESAHFDIRRHGVADLVVSVKATPETADPGEPVAVEVEVRSMTGMPLQGAELSLRFSKQHMESKTGTDGKAVFNLKAPMVSGGGGRSVQIIGEVKHAGCRPASFRGSVQVRFQKSQSRNYNVSILSRRRGLVPEVNDSLIVSVETDDGATPEAGTTVELRGAAFKGGVATATVDRHGFAEVPVRLSRDRYAEHAGGACLSVNETASTTVEVRIQGKTVGENEPVCIPVLEQVLALPFVSKPAVSPGESFDVVIERRKEAAGLPVSVDLVCADLAGPVASKIAPPFSKTVRLSAPKNRLGVCNVWARPMLDAEAASTFGLGVSCPVLVRPDLPSFPSLTFDKEQYSVKERANLTIHTPKGAPKSFAAVAVRDLARDEGEVPFEEYFLNRELRQAVLDPSTKEANLLVRAALIEYADIDDNVHWDDENATPGPEMETDAQRLAAPLRTVTAGQWMVAVEQFLAQSLASETMEDVAVGRGASRRFRRDAVALALEASGEGEALTLGEGDVTVDMLTMLDPSFTFDNAAKRVARARLVHLLSVLSAALNPEENDETRKIAQSAVPPERKLSEMVRRGVLAPSDLRDPWGGVFVIQKTKSPPRLLISAELDGFALSSPGPDGQIGTDDDIRDPWARAIPEGTLYARASGEDRLMADLAAISPGKAMFPKLLAAYDRLNDEAIGELIGDAVGDNFGYGGLGLSGTGRGGGGTGEGTIGLGHLNTIGRGGGGAGEALSSILREEFPPTLYFKAETPLSPSGATPLSIPLAEAATTYTVDAIVWREDGWRWSASTVIRVTQDLLIDAPLPERVTVGDEIVLPIGLSNRTNKARTVRVTVTGTEGLGILPIEIENVRVPSKDTIEVPARVAFSKATSGKMIFAAYDDRNNPIDAVRRSIEVKASKRKAKAAITEVLWGKGEAVIDIPKGAKPTGTAEIAVSVGSGIFRQNNRDTTYTRWLDALMGGNTTQTRKPDSNEASRLHSVEEALLGTLVGAEWMNPDRKDPFLERALEILADRMDKNKGNDYASVRLQSHILLSLAPAFLHKDSRKNLEKPLVKLLRALRIKVEDGAALFADAPWLFARCAAALYWTASEKKAGKRAAKMLERARAAVVLVDGEPWFEGGKNDETDSRAGGIDFFGAAAHLALAEIRNGNDDEAFRIVRSLARLIHADATGPAILRRLDPSDEILAEAAAALLGEGRPKTALTVAVDKKRYELNLSGDSLRKEGADVDLPKGKQHFDFPELGRGGRHTIEVKGGGSEIVLIEADATYTVNWETPPLHVGPFEVRIDGKIGRKGERSDLVLVVRNRIPRTIIKPIVEISLPAAAMEDEETERALKPWMVGTPKVSSETMQITLLPMRPKETFAIPLKWFWTAEGSFNGLGVTAWAADRKEAISVLPERKVDVSPRRLLSGGAR